jgi:hypothetical protein
MAACKKREKRVKVPDTDDCNRQTSRKEKQLFSFSNAHGSAQTELERGLEF